MQIALSPSDLAFRDEVRAFLDEALTDDLRAAAARQAGVFAEADLNRRWHRTLYLKGWVAPAWPKAHGGAGFSPVQRYIWESECAAAGAPALPAMGLQMCGPVLIGCGSEAQKAFFLPRILSGEHYWCQGYSEPQSGSDLAALQCRAVREGDAYIVNGTKLWTTHAHYANWMFLLVRTDAGGKPQQGISFLLLDMATPGIAIKPIVTLAGDHEVNQVFFDDVRIPAANLVGRENEGWTVAKYLLEFERGGAYAPRIRGLIRQIRRIAAQEAADGASLAADPAFARRLGAIEIETEAIAQTEARIVSQLSLGGGRDWAPSLLKLKGTETMQAASELAMEAIGFYAGADQRAALGLGANTPPVGPDHAATPTARYLNLRASTIYGGSSEVQRNILARAALGL
ncbi:MAG: acyl-CoA dehydrogenase family protein [Alphaproteobacteria bacterium]|nr:acyl-CoA dehydrogenase family protein [Alphaproteobacteria bacterium]